MRKSAFLCLFTGMFVPGMDTTINWHACVRPSLVLHNLLCPRDFALMENSNFGPQPRTQGSFLSGGRRSERDTKKSFRKKNDGRR
jgi:hypothetical protein